MIIRRFLLAACGLALLALPPFSIAQTTAPTGLDSLSDDRLMSDLASRGLTSLLDRALDVNNVPPAQRDGLKTLVSLKQLSTSRLSSAQRQALVAKIAAGLEAALPAMNDPRTMMQQATALLQYGVERDVNTLEYWGENPRTQAALRPVVEAVVKLLDKTAAEAQTQATALSNQIGNPNDPKARQWEQMSDLQTASAYTRHMVDYYLALALDPKDARRGEVTKEGIEFLKQYDNADSTVQPVVRLRIGKLHLARGDFDQAKEVFGSIIAGKDITPAPDAGQQWEAKYFTAVADLLAHKMPEVQQELNDLVAWQQANLPKDKAAQDGAAAAASMLQYRIHSLNAELGKTDDAKKLANAEAVKVLIDLVNRRPDLRGVIYDQLLSHLPPDADLKTLDVLLLQGFVARADEERQRPDNEKPDVKALERGIDAAREVLRRWKAAPTSVNAQLADTDALVLGFLLERLGRHAEAAEAMLDYLTDFGKDPNNASLALENALAIIGKLRSDPATADQPAVVHAYERVLPIAIKPPFSRKEFAYEYARRLQLSGKYKEAIEYFHQMPANDKRIASARFFEMVALQQQLDEEPVNSPDRPRLAAEFAKLLDEVRSRLTTAMNTALTDQERLQYRSMLVRTTLVAADAARRDQNDPRKTLQLLENFESIAKGLPNENELVGNVLYTRVQAYMALDDSNAATQALVALLKSKGGGEGAGIVYHLLEKLNAELEHARQTGDHARMLVLARNRAKLSGFLVDWARNNAVPNIKKFTYRYSVFDAATKHMAANLETDPAARKAGLEAALKLYRQLEAPENAELYRATLDANSPERNYPDPAVLLGIGLIAYDLGDYAEAQKRLGTLLTDRKLGTPTIAVEENGQTKINQNDQYWEATLKLMQSNIALAQSGDASAAAAKTETINYLKQLYIRWGREVGGKRWAPEFEKLRVELIPDYNPDAALPGTTNPTTAQ